MAKKKQMPKTVGFVALGCPKNIVDSEKMLAEIGQAGFLITSEADSADVVVINTCGFIAPARQEAIEAIKQAAKCKRKGKVGKIIVAGCLSQRMGQELFSEVDGIDAIVGLDERDRIAEIIKRTLVWEKPAAYLAGPSRIIHDDRGRLPLTPKHWSYLRISEGCSRRCSFCTIPAIRGPFRSKPKELVLAEAAELAANGTVELNIIAQDSSFYGRDLKIKDGLSKVIGELEKIDGLEWIRLMYLYPAEINQSLLETIANSKKVVNYIDMPIQHINNKILQDMGRGDSKERTQRLIENLRAAIPDVVLRTTIIAGFPSESREQFEELLEFLAWAKFDALGCFKFYPEPGTAAAKLPKQIPNKIKQERFNELMRLQQQIAFTKNRERLGKELTCLVDSVNKKGCGEGRFYGQAAHIDSVCLIRKKCSARPGQFIKAKVVETAGYDMIVERV